jgi:methylenetetrahydrofolate dehydrogenase (NADP+)/methenyltetrahydrofolate cyclohydrolase
LPPGLDAAATIAALPPHKDVDGLHPVNQGALLAGQPGLRPCTPLGVMRLLDETGVTLAGAHAVVVGRSLLVGKPVALLLLERHATVVMCHSRTRDLAGEVGRADVVVAAAGRPELVRGAWIRPGAVVIDVGINRAADGSLIGDVEFEAARQRAAFITPVPGGVGPMTVAMLLENTVTAAERAWAQAAR